MPIVVDEMQNALYMAGGSVGLTALFLAGLIALWYCKFEEKKAVNVLFAFSLLALMFAINPFYIKFVKANFEDLYKNNIYLWIIPVMPVILYSGVMAAVRLESIKKKVIFGASFVAILILAATTSYSQSDVNVAEKEYIQSDKKDILAFISEEMDRKQENSCFIWAEDEVMAHARVMDGRICTLYGRDMWENHTQQEETEGFVQRDEIYEAYTLMQSPGINCTFIADKAEKFGCDYIIFAEESFVSCGVAVPELIGSYYLEYNDSYYLVYKYLKYDERED